MALVVCRAHLVQMEPAVDGLKIIHEHGIVHGDVKAQNLLYDPQTGLVVFVDFGRSKIETSDDQMDQWVTKKKDFDNLVGIIGLRGIFGNQTIQWLRPRVPANTLLWEY